MKKMKTSYLIIAFAAATLAACNNDEYTDNNGRVEARITAGIGRPQSRATDTEWNQDAIGVMVTNAEKSGMANLYKNVKYTTTSTTDIANFSPATSGEGIFFQDAGETVTFAAYAPYQPSAAANALPGTDGVITVNTADNSDGNREKIDFLFASGATASRRIPSVIFAKNQSAGGIDCSFKHKMARLDLVLEVSLGDGFAADEEHQFTNTRLSGLVHTGTFNVVTGVAAINAGTAATVDWDITDYKTANTNVSRSYSLILLPQDASQNGLPLTVNVNGVDFKNNGDIKPNLEAGKYYTYTITVKKTKLVVSGCTITDWVFGEGGTGDATL